MQLKTTDQTGQAIILPQFPKRIISLVPSQTELLWDLGLHDELIGITKFCIHPEICFQQKEKIGGTKQLHIEKIIQLKPDLIIGNKEENEKSQIEHLKHFFPVWLSDIYTIEDAYKMITEIGKICNRQSESEILLKNIKSNFNKLKTSPVAKEKVLYVIWKNPIMVAGQSTFINSVLQQGNFINVIAQPDSRYPEITDEEISELNPDRIFLSTEPYPFKSSDQEEWQRKFPNAKISLVDGEMFTWYGSRMKYIPDYLNTLK